MNLLITEKTILSKVTNRLKTHSFHQNNCRFIYSLVKHFFIYQIIFKIQYLFESIVFIQDLCPNKCHSKQSFFVDSKTDFVFQTRLKLCKNSKNLANNSIKRQRNRT